MGAKDVCPKGLSSRGERQRDAGHSIEAKTSGKSLPARGLLRTEAAALGD